MDFCKTMISAAAGMEIEDSWSEMMQTFSKILTNILV